jgi:hypothetical protein
MGAVIRTRRVARARVGQMKWVVITAAGRRGIVIGG